MVTVNKRINPGREDGSLMITELIGLTTDSKPTAESIGLYSLFLELDTGDVYYFDGSEWQKVGAGA